MGVTICMISVKDNVYGVKKKSVPWLGARNHSRKAGTEQVQVICIDKCCRVMGNRWSSCRTSPKVYGIVIA